MNDRTDANAELPLTLLCGIKALGFVELFSCLKRLESAGTQGSMLGA
jgi:hypothetical protein